MSFSMECACGSSSGRVAGRGRPGKARCGRSSAFSVDRGRCRTRGQDAGGARPRRGYSTAFLWHYLVPMTSALWSTAPGAALEFRPRRDPLLREPRDARPASEELANRHRRQPRVCRPLLERLGVPVQLATAVRSLRRTDARGRSSRSRRRPDRGSTPSSSRRLRQRARPARRSVGRRAESSRAFESTTNETVLHTDGRSSRPGRTAPRGTTSRRGAVSYADRPTLTTR